MTSWLYFAAGIGAGAALGATLTWLAMRLHHRRLVRGVEVAAKLIGTKPGVIFAKGKKPWSKNRRRR